MTVLRLASADEARAILSAEDDFTRALGSFDRSFRMRTTESVDDAQLREFLGQQALDFTEDEAKVWQEAIDAVAKVTDVAAGEVLVAKTTGAEERSHAYTRANMIFLPRLRVEQWRGDRATYLIAHELFHVASRASPALRDATFALLGFTRIAPIEPPPELDSRRNTNPDAHRLEHSIRLGERDVVPLLLSKTSLADAIGRATVLEAVQLSLLEVGTSTLIDPSTTDWSTRLARNTKYTIHPEEVLADNHALLVRQKLGSTQTVADLDFLSAFEKALKAA